MTMLIVPPDVLDEKVRKDFHAFLQFAKREAGPKDWREFEGTLMDYLTLISGEEREKTRLTFYDRVGNREGLSLRGKAAAKRMLVSFRITQIANKKAPQKRKSGVITLGSEL